MRLVSRQFNPAVRSSSSRSLPQEEAQLKIKSWDLSLRPNPEKYVDNQSVLTLIMEKIKNSSASVIGISGVRGAGKSSLALKVLEECKQKKYFTLLISSPTGYEPRDFLLTVFQRICEEVISKLNNLFEKQETLEQLGRQERTRLSQNRLFWIALFSFTVGVPALFLIWQVQRQQIYRINDNSSITKELTLEKSKYSRELEKLKAWKKEPNSVNHNNFNRLYLKPGVPAEMLKELSRIEQLPDEIETELYGTKIPVKVINDIGTLQKLTPEVRQSKYGTSEIYPGVFSPLFELDRNLILDLIEARIISLEEKIGGINSKLETEKQRLTSYYSLYSGAFWVGILTIFSYFIILFFFRGSLQAVRQLTLVRRYPKETGLFSLAQDTLEHLRYETTLSESQNLQVSIWKSTLNFLRGKDLTTRPISLPGLTADCANFLGKIAEVFNGKVVICLDELDKIDDPDDLGNILKSIKGILGEKNSHFLLTVSEDALARFNTRRRTERDILESSLEQIVFLPRVTLSVAQFIVENMQVERSTSDEICSVNSSNILLYWIFGTGIPREIKRNVITCEQAGLDPLNSNRWDVWQILWINLLDSSIDWALMLEHDDEVCYQFITRIEAIKEKKFDGSSSLDNAKNWCKEIINLWSEQPSSFVEAKKDDTRLQDIRWQRTILELIVAASSVVLIAESSDLLNYKNEDSPESQTIADLDAIFNCISNNIHLAKDKLRDYLSHIGVQ